MEPRKHYFAKIPTIAIFIVAFSQEGPQWKMASEKQMRGGHLKSLTQKEVAAQMHNGLSIKTYFIRLQTASA